ncbi:Uncharacterised protein [Clostridium tetani]|uniref:Uncharacterized protein n=1 Tax=Clostridium tetani TaxID=1513 RepID=A0ABY0EPU4_CLOTA|nr:hypothetical protein [Clostridium tetani]AVP53580.1 hypothetical protein C3B72_00020 [Clostridium tetani]KHO39480.1 hypothetical protein OR62_05690 [Clostridium tetani]RXI53372.1 hypothetical protein DP131_11325 [Clostridium tetani]RXI67266.1 hypothetical protein DQN76_11730 [Clostridium tetani]RXI75181.1 hypothetical protein DP128_11500 [Clostridium tetani]
MSKKTKILSALACGLLLSSSLSFTSVQAATIKTNSASNKIINRAVINDEIYSTYCKLEEEACRDMYQYLHKNEETPTVTGLRDVLVKNNHVSRTVANNIAYSLFSLGTECSRGLFPESYESGISVIQSNKHEGEYTVIGYDKRDPNAKYSVYAVLTPEDVKFIRGKVIGSDKYELAKYIISNGIVSDYDSAYHIADAVSCCDFEYFDIDANLLVLSNIELNDCFIARLPR